MVGMLSLECGDSHDFEALNISVYLSLNLYNFCYHRTDETICIKETWFCIKHMGGGMG